MKMNLMGSDHTLQAITGNEYLQLACRKKKQFYEKKSKMFEARNE